MVFVAWKLQYFVVYDDGNLAQSSIELLEGSCFPQNRGYAKKGIFKTPKIFGSLFSGYQAIM